MQNWNPTIRKLQIALKQYGYIIVVSNTQIYNNSKDGFITLTSVRHNNKVLFRSANKVLIVKNLAKMLEYCRNQNGEIIEDEMENLLWEKE